MAELGGGSGTGYPTAIDTDASTESTSTLARADCINDANAAIIAIENELGIAPSGSKDTVVEFLQVAHNADGTHKTSAVYVTPTIASFANATHDHQNAAGGGATLTSPTIAGATLTTPTITTPVMTGTGWPSFHAHRNTTDQTSVADGVWTKVKFTTEEYDTGDCFNADANDDDAGGLESRFTPAVAGKYLLYGAVSFLDLNAANLVGLDIWKNGATANRMVFQRQSASTPGWAHISVIVDSDANDYFELAAFQNGGGAETIDGPVAYTYFGGSRIA